MSEATKNEMAAEEILPLPFRVLWWRALVAIAIGYGVAWLFATVWCQVLGQWLFPASFPNGRGMVSVNMSVGLSMTGGALTGLVLVLARGNVWLRAFVTVIGIWLGSLVFFMGVLPSIVSLYFLLTKLPPDPYTPKLTTTDLKLSIWAMLPMLLSGGSVLFSVFKMHVSNNANWFQTTKENIRENFMAVFRPNEKHRMERFVLQSPLSFEECQARLSQIATIETSRFAFWEQWPLPGFKKINVKVNENQWRFSGRYQRAPFTFNVEAAPDEHGTQLRCVSIWIPMLQVYLIMLNLLPALMCVFSLLFAVNELASAIARSKPTGTTLFSAILLLLVGLLISAVFWAYQTGLSRAVLWQGRKQELLIIAALEDAFEAQIIEREPVRYKLGLIQQL